MRLCQELWKSWRDMLFWQSWSYTTGAVQKLHGTGITEEANEDASTEDDDFIGDLPPELDNIMIFSDAETDSNIVSPVLEEK